MSRRPVHTTPVGCFADLLLARDLPHLDDVRRGAAVAFVERRVDGLASFTRFGVRIIATVVDLAGRVIGRQRALDLAVSLPLPLVSEYPRLVRSLGYTYVWETWPSTELDGTTR